jgi:hypothetical protein
MKRQITIHSVIAVRGRPGVPGKSRYWKDRHYRRRTQTDFYLYEE